MVYNKALSIEELKAKVPSAFALAPYHKQSDRYAFIPTSNVIAGMAANGFLPVQAGQSRTRVADKKDFTKHMIRFRSIQSIERGAAVLDEQVLEAVLINSHDGTSAYKLMAGIFRFVCENGMVVSDSLIGSVNIRHSGDVVSEVIEGTANIFESAPKVLAVVNDWKALDMSHDEQLALATAAHIVRFPDADDETPAPVSADRLLEARRHADMGSDLWSTFNRIQENSLKGIRRSYSRRQKAVRGITSIDGNVNLNRALFTLGQRFAELKSAA